MEARIRCVAGAFDATAMKRATEPSESSSGARKSRATRRMGNSRSPDSLARFNAGVFVSSLWRPGRGDKSSATADITDTRTYIYIVWTERKAFTGGCGGGSSQDRSKDT